MKRPNFFIIGAPKCGTTSLSSWLNEHPQVFFSPVKEPHFFNFDYGDRTCRSLAKYETLFRGASENHLAVGEGSVRYLYSSKAVPSILSYSPNARFIVMLRNPVEMAYALYEQTVFNGEENIKDFENAWWAQSRRRYGASVPSDVDPQQLLYGDACMVGEQLMRVYEHVASERVLVLNLEHVKSDARREYLKVLRFLDLSDDGRTAFPVRNTAKERAFPALWQLTRWSNKVLRALGVPHVRTGLTAFVSERLKRERPRPSLSSEMRQELTDYFSDDVKRLELLTGWDLAHWRSIPARETD